MPPKIRQQKMRSRKNDTAQTCETRSFWRVGIARNATFVHSCVAAVGLQRQLPKTGGREGSAAQDVAALNQKSGLETKIAKNWHGRTTF